MSLSAFDRRLVEMGMDLSAHLHLCRTIAAALLVFILPLRPSHLGKGRLGRVFLPQWQDAKEGKERASA